MNKHYQTQQTEFNKEKIFKPEQEGKPLEITKKLEKLGKEQLQENHFQDLKDRRGLKEETIKQFIKPVNTETIEALKEDFESESLVKSGWFKYTCKICEQEYGPNFERFGDFQHHLQIEHGRDNPEKYRDHLFSLIPEKGYMIKYRDLETGELVYSNIRDREHQEGMNKYCQPHQEYVEARKSFTSGIFPAMDEVGGDKLVITEGEFKSLALREQGWDSVAIAGVSLSQENLDRLSQICSQYNQVVYVVDDDMGGVLSIPSMTSEMNHRNQRITVQISQDKDIDDKHTESKEFKLNPSEPVNLLQENIERLDRNKHDIGKYGKCQDLLEVFFQTVQGLKRSKQESLIKSSVKKINKVLDEEYNTNTVKSELGDWREQFERDKRREKHEEEEKKEEVQEFQETIQVNDVEIALNPVKPVNVLEHVKTFTEIKKNGKGNVKPDKKFKVYEIAFGKGTDEETFKLLTEPEKKLNLGDKYLPLKEADLSREDYNQWIRKKFREAEEDGYEGSFQDFKKDNFEGITFEIADHVNQESIRKIRDMDNQVIRDEIVEKYLNNGYEYDEKLTKVNHSKIVRHSKSKVDAEDVMPYNPHSAYITDTKVGKSYNSDRVGVKMDKMSSSGLLGYASADDLRKGTLDGMEEPFFADEIRHGNEENIGDKLLTIFEQGSSRISKGQKDMKPEFFSSFTYMSNPKKSDNMDQIDYFMDFVEKLGNNSQALGSRLGVLIFDLGELKKARGTPLPKDQRKKLETVVEWIKSDVADKYTGIERQLQDWLHQEYPDSYKKRIDGWKADSWSQKANEFLEGHKDSYRHARGQALRMAVYKNIGKVVKDSHSIEEIKEDADDKFRELLDINLFSIRNLSSVLSQKDRIRQHKKALLDAEENLYMKLFVKTVISKSKDDLEVFKTIEPVKALQPVFSEIKEDLDSVDDGSKYWNFSRIMYELEDNLGRVNKRLRDRYGLKLNEDGGNLFVKISNMDKFQVYPKISSESVPSVPDVPRGSEESTPPTYLDDQDEEDEKGGGGVKKEKPEGTLGTKSTDKTSNQSESTGSSVIFSKDPEIGEDIEEETAIQILEFFQEHGEMKKREAHEEIGSNIEDFERKLSDLKALNMLEYNGHSHQYSITDKGLGMANNQGLEKVIE